MPCAWRNAVTGGNGRALILLAHGSSCPPHRLETAETAALKYEKRDKKGGPTGWGVFAPENLYQVRRRRRRPGGCARQFVLQSTRKTLRKDSVCDAAVSAEVCGHAGCVCMLWAVGVPGMDTVCVWGAAWAAPAVRSWLTGRAVGSCC